MTGQAPAHNMRSTTFKKALLTRNICFRVTLEQLEYLEELSKTYHCTVPAMLRIIIQHEMDKTKKVEE